MFDSLTDKLGQTFKRLKGHGKLSGSNVKDARPTSTTGW